jgi:hypothetical protein
MELVPCSNAGFLINVDENGRLISGARFCFGNSAGTCSTEYLHKVGLKTFRYLYDFGDRWEHCAKMEKVLSPDPALR